MKPETKRIGGALLLGPLSLFATFAIAILVFLVVFLMDMAVGKGRVIGTLGGDLDTASVSLSVFMVISITAGSAVAAYVSWRLFRSMGLTALTLLAGLASHVVFMVGSAAVPFGDTSPVARSLNAKQEAADAYADSVHAQYASIDTLSYEMVEPMAGLASKKHPELGPLYRKIVLRVPVTIQHPGSYKLVGFYEDRQGRPFQRKGSTGYDTLGVGGQQLSVAIDFGRDGVRSPEGIGGLARVELYGVVDRRELRALLRSRMSLTQEEQDELRRREEKTPSLASGPTPVKVTARVADFSWRTLASGRPPVR